MKKIRYLGISLVILSAFTLVTATLAAVAPREANSPYPGRGADLRSALDTTYLAWAGQTGFFLTADEISPVNAAVPLTLGEVITWFTPPGGGLPVGLEHDGNGNLYMTEVADDEVHLMDTNGNGISSFPLVPPQTYNGIGVTTDGSYLYLTDTGGQDVDRYSLAGDYLSSFFVYSETVFPEGITYNPETGNLYVVDGVYFSPPEIVAEYSISGSLSTTYNLPSGSANGLAYDPLRCTYWTYDDADDTVQHLSPSFTLIESFPGTQAAGFASGEGVAVINNTLYVAAKNDNTIVAFDISLADTAYADLCTVIGTLTGQVTSANTGLELPGASIAAFDGASTYTTITDSSGFYTLTLKAGTYTVTASLAGYSPVTESGIQVFSGMTVLDFALPAGGLTASPERIERWVTPGSVVTTPLVLSNTGLAAFDFQIQEIGPESAWVAVNPLTGTIFPGEGQLVDIIFDSRMVTSTGTYTAALGVQGNFENEPPVIDMAMHVRIQIYLPISRRDQ